MNEDLDYVYLAPVTHWRGGRIYIEPAVQSLAPQIGLAEGLVIREPRQVTKACPVKKGAVQRRRSRS